MVGSRRAADEGRLLKHRSTGGNPLLDPVRACARGAPPRTEDGAHQGRYRKWNRGSAPRTEDGEFGLSGSTDVGD